MPILNGSGPMGIDTFTTGFYFASTLLSQPIIFGSVDFQFDRDLAALGDGQALQFLSLDLGLVHQEQSLIFQLPPDHLVNCSGAAPGLLEEGCGEIGIIDNSALSNPRGYNVEVTELTSGDYGVVIRFVLTIQGVDYNWDGNETNFRLEAIVHYLPVPAAGWLFGSGLLGLVGVRGKTKVTV